MILFNGSRGLGCAGRNGVAAFITGFVSLAGVYTVRAFTAEDADRIFTSYEDAFYFTQGTNGYFRATTEGGKTWFWERAEQMEMLLDVYERTSNSVCLTLFSNVFNGFITDHSRNWSRNEFNDDIMWMVIACARGYEHTGNAAIRDVARANFDLCYARAWSTNLGGGLWWKTDNQSKNACVNGPAAIAAYLLYKIHDDTNYLAKSKNIYRWERTTLFDTSSGAVSDSINREGKRATFNLTYNQGTFIGAANFLGHTNDARLAADFMMNRLSRNGMMPRYRQSGDGGGFNGIGARWLAKCMKQRGWERAYQGWLQANADAAWRARRTSDNLSWSRWPRPTPEGVLYSWACSSAVVLMHVVPPTQTRDADGGKPSFGRETDDLRWTESATNAQGEILATITVDVSDTPDLVDWARKAGEFCRQWYPKLVSLLASPGFVPPREVQLIFRNDYHGVASTSGDQITISADWVRHAPDDFGMIIHELTHVVQAYPSGRNPGWLVEGLADYIRHARFEPQAPRPRIDPDRASYLDSYKTTAIFLEWVEKHYDPQLIQQLNRAMREGTYKRELFEQRTGKTVDELWAEFAATLRSDAP